MEGAKLMKNGRCRQVFSLVMVLFLVVGLFTPFMSAEASEQTMSVAEAIANNSGKAEVEGYIVGTRNVFEGPFTVATNIQIADHPDEKALVKTLPVQLPIGAIRNGLNLVDHPNLLGKKVRVTGSLESYFSVPGLKTPTSYEILEEDGEIPELIIPEVSIKKAREMIGQTVITEGVVNVDNGLLQPGRVSVYIQDDQAGIQLFAYQANQFPELKEGDRVKVKGKVGEYNRVTQIEVEQVDVLQSGQAVDVKEVTVADYTDAAIAESHEGQLVTFTGFIYSIPAYSSGGTNITVIDEELNVVIIRAWESTGMDLSEIEPNQWYEITAISSQYNNTYQVLPRSNADMKPLDVQKDKPFSGGKEVRAIVERVVDGDTIRLDSPVFGATNVRFLNIDTLETYHSIKNDLDQNQMDHGKRAGEHLETMLQAGDEVILRIGEEPLDTYGRLLAEVITIEGVNTNYEMVKAGHAVTYFIWPFESAAVEEYGKALKEAREQQVGIWNPADPMLEYPFEFRARERGSEPSRPVGDYRTKYYVPASEWRSVQPEYRVFFNHEDDALSAGYQVQPLSNLELTQEINKVLTKLNESNDIYARSAFNVLFKRVNKIEHHLGKMEGSKNPRAAEAHYHNFVRAVNKLDQDLEQEYQKNNISEKAYEAIDARIDLFALEETGLKKAN